MEKMNLKELVFIIFVKIVWRMVVSEIQLYEALSENLGKEKAKALTEYIEAKVEIKAFLKGLKEKGLKSANLLDIIMATNLASEQIERVMCSLERD